MLCYSAFSISYYGMLCSTSHQEYSGKPMGSGILTTFRIIISIVSFSEVMAVVIVIVVITVIVISSHPIFFVGDVRN